MHFVGFTATATATLTLGFALSFDVPKAGAAA